MLNEEFKNRIRVKTPCNDDLNLQHTKCNLKTSNYEAIVKHNGPWLKLADEV